MKRRLAWIGLLVAVAALARALVVPVAWFDGTIREERIRNANGDEIAASVLLPAGAGGGPAAADLRAVVLCHGVSSSRRSMEPLAREMARRGLLAVTFDYGGHGDSYDRSGGEAADLEDFRAAIALARRSGARGGIALAGHSMGVLSAALLALGLAPVILAREGALPLYLWQGLAFRLHYTLDSLATRLVALPRAGEFLGSTALYALLALEIAAPGRALGLLGAFALRIFRSLGGRVPKAMAAPAAAAAPRDAAATGGAPPAPAALPLSRRKLGALLAALVLVAAALFGRRVSEGLLSGEGAVGTIALAGLRLLVLPALAMAASIWAMRLVAYLRGSRG